jgi:hypothetical protein
MSLRPALWDERVRRLSPAFVLSSPRTEFRNEDLAIPLHEKISGDDFLGKAVSNKPEYISFPVRIIAGWRNDPSAAMQASNGVCLPDFSTEHTVSFPTNRQGTDISWLEWTPILCGPHYRQNGPAFLQGVGECLRSNSRGRPASRQFQVLPLASLRHFSIASRVIRYRTACSE